MVGEDPLDIRSKPESNVGQECPTWADGISTLKPEIHIIGRQEGLKDYSTLEEIRTTRFSTVAEKHQLKKIDILQIDAEGYDKEILDQVWVANFRPSIIKVEVNYLTYVDIKEMKATLETYKYRCFFEKDDFIAVKTS
jgi:hypothetical protein